ncbi:lipopolysaccharide biosynthesis protein [Thermotoga petrophila RKU-1]|uniref:Lipopolysaccharide biosynthesis protein n=1 Tax=Thermotoga petrophila (strain ATCC BAA-488 / DSM 13995 / JCM 10881 / RKU-1) TaxID=390874 RepID=A5IJE1_THEP1|nr:exopolysaccharide transport family protein [Thermotoga petrophila]ABQ46314.1 lipopolysaccharide biosynthesis protein [Thermotoga petrophila RKU-1]
MEERELTLGDILLMFKRRSKLFWLVLVLTVLATGIYLLFATPKYEASAKVKVSTQKGMSLGLSIEGLLGGLSSLLGGGGGSLEDEIQIMLSRRNIVAVIDELDLVHKLLDEKDIKKAMGNGLTEDDLKLSLYSYMVEKLITVEPVKNSNILEVKFTWRDPKLAAEVANKIVENYVKISESIAKTQLGAKKEFLEEQIPKVEQELREAENKLKVFKEQNKIYSVEAQYQTLIERYASLLQKMEESQIAMEAAQKQAEFFSNELKDLDVEIEQLRDSITFDPIISQLKSRLINIQIELAGLMERYTESNPAVVQKKAEFEETQKQLKAELERLLTSQVKKTGYTIYGEALSNLIKAESERILYQTQYEAFKKLFENFEKELSKLPELEQKLIELERDYKVKETIYTTLLQAKYESLISEAAITANVNVIDWAVPPLSPSKPNKKLTLAVGGVLGIFLGILAVFFAEFSDRRIKSESEAEYLLGVEKIVARVPLTSKSEVIEKALGIPAVKAGKVVFITAIEDGAGVSTIAKHMANLVSKKEKVLLFTEENAEGSFDKRDLFELLKDPEILENLKQSYDRIIIDAPSLKRTPEFLPVSEKSDTVYIVIRLEHTYSEDLKMLHSLKKIDGFILNGLTRRNSAYVEEK